MSKPAPIDSQTSDSGFDKLARPYRWMEWLSFGPFLRKARVRLLHKLQPSENVLVVGDGDGRFVAAFLREKPQARVAAVDVSGSMLRELQKRVERAGCADRLSVHRMDARSGLPAGSFDLVCTHFFLDCLTPAEVSAFAVAVRQSMPRGQWLISEFATTTGPLRWVSQAVVGALYAGFRVLTGLRISSLPDYRRALVDNGFTCIAAETQLAGLLRSELWCTGENPAPMHPGLQRDSDGSI